MIRPGRAITNVAHPQRKRYNWSAQAVSCQQLRVSQIDDTGAFIVSTRTRLSSGAHGAALELFPTKPWRMGANLRQCTDKKALAAPRGPL
jgi:hypothetical protein